MKATIKHIQSKIDRRNYKIIDKFIYFLQEEYPLNDDVVINFVGERIGKMTTGSRRKDSNIFVLTKKRIIRDTFKLNFFDEKHFVISCGLELFSHLNQSATRSSLHCPNRKWIRVRS